MHKTTLLIKIEQSLVYTVNICLAQNSRYSELKESASQTYFLYSAQIRYIAELIGLVLYRYTFNVILAYIQYGISDSNTQTRFHYFRFQSGRKGHVILFTTEEKKNMYKGKRIVECRVSLSCLQVQQSSTLISVSFYKEGPDIKISSRISRINDLNFQ